MCIRPANKPPAVYGRKGHSLDEADVTGPTKPSILGVRSSVLERSGDTFSKAAVAPNQSIAIETFHNLNYRQKRTGVNRKRDIILENF